MPVSKHNQDLFDYTEKCLIHANSHCQVLIKSKLFSKDKKIARLAASTQNLLSLIQSFTYKWRGTFKYPDIQFLKNLRKYLVQFIEVQPEYYQFQLYNNMMDDGSAITETHQELIKLLPKHIMQSKKIERLYHAGLTALSKLDFADLEQYLWKKLQAKPIVALVGEQDPKLFKTILNSVATGFSEIAQQSQEKSQPAPARKPTKIPSPKVG